MGASSMSYVRTEGRLISRIEPGDTIEKRVHGPASDGYLTIVTWRQIGGRPGEWFPGSPFELSPAEQKGLLAFLGRDEWCEIENRALRVSKIMEDQMGGFWLSAPEGDWMREARDALEDIANMAAEASPSLPAAEGGSV